MIWTAYAIAATALAWASAKDERHALTVFVAGLLAVYVAKLTLAEPVFWLFSSGIWVFIGWYVATVAGGKLAHNALLLVVAGLLVFPARLWGAYEAGNFFLVLSDLCGIAFVVSVGRRGAIRFVDGIRRMGAYRGIRDLHFVDYRVCYKAREEVGARHERG